MITNKDKKQNSFTLIQPFYFNKQKLFRKLLLDLKRSRNRHTESGMEGASGNFVVFRFTPSQKMTNS